MDGADRGLLEGTKSSASKTKYSKVLAVFCLLIGTLLFFKHKDGFLISKEDVVGLEESVAVEASPYGYSDGEYEDPENIQDVEVGSKEEQDKTCKALKKMKACVTTKGCQWDGEKCGGYPVYTFTNRKDTKANPWVYYSQQNEVSVREPKLHGDYVNGECYCAGVLDKERKGGSKCKTYYKGQAWCYISPETGSGCTDSKHSRFDGYEWSFEACRDEKNDPYCVCDEEFEGKHGGPDCKSHTDGKAWCYVHKGKMRSACRDAKISYKYPDHYYSYQACYAAYDVHEIVYPNEPKLVQSLDEKLHKKRVKAQLLKRKKRFAKELKRRISVYNAKIKQLEKEIAVLEKEKVKGKVEAKIERCKQRIADLRFDIREAQAQGKGERLEIQRQLDVIYWGR